MNTISQKYTINTGDLLKTAENALIFLLPIVIAHQTQISAYLTLNGVNTQFVAVLFSLFAYLARQFASGPAISASSSVTL